MANPINLIGREFHSLTVIGGPYSRNYSGKKRRFWQCLCECGETFEALGDSLKSGNTKSCGCLKRGDKNPNVVTHGMSKSKEYSAWAAALARCTNPKHQSFSHYGARGIFMCQEWADGFESFFNDMGRAPEGLELDRIDNDGPYAKWNCKWSTRSEQVKNQRRHLIGSFSYRGEKLTMREISRRTGFNATTITKRMRVNGESTEEAVAHLLSSNRVRVRT